MSVAKENVKVAINNVMVYAECIRNLKEVPSGHLYAMVMDKVSLEQHNSILQTLENAGLIKIALSHLITWTGPKIENN